MIVGNQPQWFSFFSYQKLHQLPSFMQKAAAALPKSRISRKTNIYMHKFMFHSSIHFINLHKFSITATKHTSNQKPYYLYHKPCYSKLSFTNYRNEQ